MTAMLRVACLLTALAIGSAAWSCWDRYFELKPYDPTRTLSLIPAAVASPSASQADYLAFAHERFYDGEEYVGDELGDAHQYVAALRAARYFRITGSEGWALAALEAAARHRSYLETCGASCRAGTPQLAAAARVYTLLRDGRDRPPGWERALYRWLVVLERRTRRLETGPMNRAIGSALGIDALGELCEAVGTCGTAKAASRSAYADSVWADWYARRGIAENSTGYWGLDMLYLVWWFELNPDRSRFPEAPLEDPAMRALAKYTLNLVTPIGAIPQYGDVVGFNSTPEHYIGVFEAWASAYRDGRYRWAAQQLFGYIHARKSDMGQWPNVHTGAADSALMAAVAIANEAGGPVPAVRPAIGSLALKRPAWVWSPAEAIDAGAPAFEMVAGAMSDKVVLRSGWAPHDTYALIGASRLGGHGHFDASAVNTYVSNGSVLLASNGYRLKDAYYHNAFSIQPETLASVPRRTPWKNGAVSPQLTAAAGRIEVTFAAKSISGSRTIGVFRPSAGGATRVSITDDWATYTVEQVYEGPGSAQRTVMFVPLEAYQAGASSAVDAVLLIDDVAISWVGPGPPPPGSNLPVRYHFHRDEEGWHPRDQHAGAAGECSRGIQDTASCAVEVTHDATDGAAAAGALEISLDLGRYGRRDTTDVSVTTFEASGDFGYARIRMPDHLGTPFDVERHVLFLGKLGLWIRDEAVAIGPYKGSMGPGWHFTAVTVEDRDELWVNGAQTALALPHPSEPRYLMHWENRAKDLLVKFRSSSPDASLIGSDVKSPPPEHSDGVSVFSAYRRRISHEVTRSFLEGEELHFNSFLRPHAPAEDPSSLADSVQWLIDTDELSIVAIEGEVPVESVIVGINERGDCVDVPYHPLSTDAVAFRVVYGPNGIEAYDVVDATSLGEGTCGTPGGRWIIDRASPVSAHGRDLPDRSDHLEGTDLLLGSALSTEVENRASNGTFTDDVDGWEGRFDGVGATAKEQTEPGTRLFWSPPDGTTSAGLVVNVATGSTRPPASTTGAVCRLQDGHVIEGGTGTHVSFSARSLSGGTLLRVGLANSPTGPSAIARLTPRVEDYAVDLEAAAGEIVFSTTDASGNAVDGTFWLDNVVVTSRH